MAGRVIYLQSRAKVKLSENIFRIQIHRTWQLAFSYLCKNLTIYERAEARFLPGAWATACAAPAKHHCSVRRYVPHGLSPIDWQTKQTGVSLLACPGQLIGQAGVSWLEVVAGLNKTHLSSWQKSPDNHDEAIHSDSAVQMNRKASNVLTALNYKCNS